MGIVKKLLERFDALEDTIEDEAKRIVIANMDYIISVLEDKQLGIGEDSLGRPLSWSSGVNSGDGFYTRNTQLIAEQEFTAEPKIEGQPYNFQWTGSYFNSLGLKTLSRNNYSIFSTDGKAAFMRKAYGIHLDISKKNNDFVNEAIIEPELIKYVEENWWR